MPDTRTILVALSGVLVVILIFAISIFAFLLLNSKSVKDYADCVNADGVILESYPSQCIYNGKTYIQKIITSNN